MRERVVALRLAAHAKRFNLIPTEQFGFRKKHSTTAQLARISDYITHGYNLRKHTCMVLLDLEKAYDTIWTRGLLRKLIHFNFPAHLIVFLHSYLSGRTFNVIVDGVASTSRTQRAGLPQGAVLSPILFTFYISEIPRFPHVQLALYADDTALVAVMARGHNRTQAHHGGAPTQTIFCPLAPSGQYLKNRSHLLY